MRILKVENGIVLDAIICNIDQAPEGNWVQEPNEWVGIGLAIDAAPPAENTPEQLA